MGLGSYFQNYYATHDTPFNRMEPNSTNLNLLSAFTGVAVGQMLLGTLGVYAAIPFAAGVFTSDAVQSHNMLKEAEKQSDKLDAQLEALKQKNAPDCDKMP